MEQKDARCSRCESLPERPRMGGRLYLWFPVWHTLMKAVRTLNRLDLDHEVLADSNGVIVPLPQGVDGGAFLTGLAESLRGHEMRSTRALHVPDDREPGLEDYPRVTTLASLTQLERSGWLLDLLRDGRLTSWFQPLVSAADTSSVFGHEALMRGLQPGDGEPFTAGSILEAAREADLLFQVDAMARRSAIRRAAEVDLDGHLFINFTPSSIYDPVYCLRSTVAAIQETGFDADRVVFEVIESSRVPDLDHLKGVLAFYRENGFRVALDDLGAGYSSLALTHEIRPDFVKLDRNLIQGVTEDPYKAVIAEKALQLTAELGVRSIAEGVETEAELAWVRERGADLVQGYLIARPGPEPAADLPRR